MKSVDRTPLADQVRPALYAAAFAVAMGSVWILGWSRSREAELPDDFSKPDPIMEAIAAHADEYWSRPDPQPAVVDVRQ